MKEVLSKREMEIAELLAWGASSKEVACKLFLSTRTVENHRRNIYEKIGVGKASELSAWYFCTNFNISFDLSPIKPLLKTLAITIFLLSQIYAPKLELRACRIPRIERHTRFSRKNETDYLSTYACAA